VLSRHFAVASAGASAGLATVWAFPEEAGAFPAGADLGVAAGAGAGVEGVAVGAAAGGGFGAATGAFFGVAAGAVGAGAGMSLANQVLTPPCCEQAPFWVLAFV